MNRDQRQILAALDALGWTRFRYAMKGFPTYVLRNGIVAIVRPCRTVEVARWVNDEDSLVERIAVIDPIYGRNWYGRTARIVDRTATSKRTPRELGILLHALGGGGRSRGPLGWRNHFRPGGDDVAACDALVGAGMMIRFDLAGLYAVTYTVTKLGAAEVGVTL